MKDFIEYPEALELKQLGFDEPCFAEYFLRDNETPFLMIGEYEILEAENAGDDMAFACNCPTYSQAFRWFREKYNLKSWIQEHTTDTFIYEIRPHVLLHYREDETYVYTGYEKAELACLRKLIEIVKEN